MMKLEEETLFPLNVELKVNGEGEEGDISQKEQIFLTKSQYEVLELVTRILGQTISEYITENILSILEFEVEDTIPWELKKKLQGKSVAVEGKREKEGNLQ